MNGFIHYILQMSDVQTILIIAYDNYQKSTLQHLYSDASNVKLLLIEHPNGRFTPFIESLNGRPFQSPIEINGERFLLLNFGVHSQYRSATLPGYSWADSFYLQGNLDPSFRFSHFQLPSAMNNAHSLYKRVVERVGEDYILLNDEPKSNRNLNANLLQRHLSNTQKKDLPVLYLGLARYQYPLLNELNNHDLSKELSCNSLLDLWILIKNANECHFMDSSIACMTDLIQDCKASLHLHAYVTETVDPQHPIFVQNKWKLWYKEDLE